jgi:putative alpha-1,2-mannosidase
MQLEVHYKNVYISAIKKNDSNYSKNYINYDDIMNGSIFSAEMSSEPNLNLGVGDSSKPYSASQD